MKWLKLFFEPKIFGVCTAIAEKLSMPIPLVRMFFIYLSFVTFFSPVIFYLSLAFFMRFKALFTSKRISVRDL
ncbi:MAG: PspC domain-containing protein [Bacteroidia bacterium]|jgi:phage shock protein PspC (stress-responsive transcriptional regulator)|nr:PspC domain-containing protein [Bacteroidia bacterium]MCO5254287.1 PspC domain-containing protein [Bacteroidota bacterium]MCZ2130174.1 PspC domain-containing protein [Bacteroidia bacterium]